MRNVLTNISYVAYINIYISNILCNIEMGKIYSIMVSIVINLANSSRIM